MGHQRTETETRAIRVFFFYRFIGISRGRDDGDAPCRRDAQCGGGFFLLGRYILEDRRISRGKKVCAYGGTGLFLHVDDEYADLCCLRNDRADQHDPAVVVHRRGDIGRDLYILADAFAERGVSRCRDVCDEDCVCAFLEDAERAAQKQECSGKTARRDAPCAEDACGGRDHARMRADRDILFHEYCGRDVHLIEKRSVDE